MTQAMALNMAKLSNPLVINSVHMAASNMSNNGGGPLPHCNSSAKQFGDAHTRTIEQNDNKGYHNGGGLEMSNNLVLTLFIKNYEILIF